MRRIQMDINNLVIDNGRIGGTKQMEYVADDLKSRGVTRVILANVEEYTHWWLFENLVAYIGTSESFQEMENTTAQLIGKEYELKTLKENQQ